MKLLLAVSLLGLSLGSASKIHSNPELTKYLSQREKEFDLIDPERKLELDELAQYIREQKASQKDISLVFICTHNSRRSHMAQIWARTAALHYGIAEKMQFYSGGTEATAFNDRAVRALERAGFSIEKNGTDNPRYHVTTGSGDPGLTCWSKKYSDLANPQSGFAAVMTCSQADQACPLVEGSDFRIAIAYNDPKEFDGQPKEAEAYDQRCAQIAREMLYCARQVRK